MNTTTALKLPPQFNPASFRDREGRVFTAQDRIFRTLSKTALERMSALASDKRLDQLIEAKLIVPSWLVNTRDVAIDPDSFGDIVLEHERLPLMTYPYEWSFDMLRDAALLTLDLLAKCLDMGLILKDATPYNLTLHKNRMIFIDTLSIDHYKDGQPWDGYSQFCREFLFPLMLTAYKGVEFQSWYRGELNGLKPADMSRLLGFAGLFSKGVLSHVHLQAWCERFLANKTVDMRKRFNVQNFPKKMILGMLKKLRGIITSMKYRGNSSTWADYETNNSYDEIATRKKTEFVRAAAEKYRLSKWVDMGCNAGAYSLALAPYAERIIGLDVDPYAVNAFYLRCKDAATPVFYPMICDLLNPSPALGWRLQERPSLFSRVDGEGFLALALVHHICIGKNVLIEDFVALLKTVGKIGVIEWVDKEDKMVARLLSNRLDIFNDYHWDHFRNCLQEHFRLEEVVETHEGQRKLCLVVAK